jgi:paraquat-inducible protein A
LWREDVLLVAALVFVTVVVVPATQIIAMLYVLLPLQFGAVPPFVEFPLRLFQVAKPWGMVEVFILGILVSLVKLSHMAQVITGVALWAFAALVVVFAALGNAFDPVRRGRVSSPTRTHQAGYAVVTDAVCCRVVIRRSARCPRCAVTLHVASRTVCRVPQRC